MQYNRILILDLLEILQNYTDEDHQLNQQNIIEILENDYGYEDVRRQTVKDNLEKLRKLDMKNFEIGCEEDGERIVKDKKTGKEKELIIYSDFRYIHKFTQGELRLIIDSILFSKHINLSYRKELIEKLESLTSKHFKSGMNHIKSVKTTNKENKDLFFNIEELDKAITNSKKISFNYASYELEDKGPTLVARKNSKGKKREYIINPYYMVASNGRHYLICNNDPFKNASPYRIDRICQVRGHKAFPLTMGPDPELDKSVIATIAGKKKSTRRSLPRIESMLEWGVVKEGDLIVPKGKEGEAELLSNGNVKVNEEEKSIQAWLKNIYGWSSVDTYAFAMHKETNKTLSEIRKEYMEQENTEGADI